MGARVRPKLTASFFITKARKVENAKEDQKQNAETARSGG